MRADEHGVSAHRTAEGDRLLDRTELGFEQALHLREIVHRHRHAPTAHRARDARERVAAIQQQATLLGVGRIGRGVVQIEQRRAAPVGGNVDAIGRAVGERAHEAAQTGDARRRFGRSTRALARGLGPWRGCLRRDSADEARQHENGRTGSTHHAISFYCFLRTESKNLNTPGNASGIMPPWLASNSR